MMDTYDAWSGTISREDGANLRLKGKRKSIFDYLLATRPRLSTAEQIALLLYQGENGPTREQNTVKVHLHKLAQQLSGCSIHLTRPGFHRTQGGYGLAGDVVWKNKPQYPACPCCGQKLPEYDS